MKPCPNCRTIHQDDYNGTCMDCGAPLGNVVANQSSRPEGGSLQFAYARQMQEAVREDQTMRPEAVQARKGDFSNVKLEDSIVAVASRIVRQDMEQMGMVDDAA